MDSAPHNFLSIREKCPHFIICIQYRCLPSQKLDLDNTVQ